MGTVVRIDRFGNIITNLPSEDKSSYSVGIEGRRSRMDFYPNYNAAPDDALFLIEGSCKTLEISLKNSNANKRLKLKTGQRIEIA